MKLIIMGAPGAGKGTQASIISDRLSVPTISTGAIIRNNIRENTEFGREAKKFIDEGKLVPDELILKLMNSRIEEPDCKNGYILDGFPRTIAQAEALEQWGVVIDKVLLISVPDEEIVTRLSGRRECSKCSEPYHTAYNKPRTEGKCDKCGHELIQRSDDRPETIRERLKVFHAQTEPICEYYKKLGKLTVAVGKEEISDTTAEVMKALGI